MNFTTKKCSSCIQIKDINFFTKDSKAYDGLCCYCKNCRKDQKRKYYLENKKDIAYKQKQYVSKNTDKIKKTTAKYRSKNKELIKIKQKQIYQNNKEKRLEYARKRYIEHRDIIKSRVKEYCNKNRSKVTGIKAKYRAAKYNATPKWLTREHHEQIQEFYTLARELAWLNEGEILQVDHIIPLQGKEVCGLHVPWNLQVLTKSNNISKFNNLIDGLNN
jgi:hypothetical protein